MDGIVGANQGVIVAGPGFGVAEGEGGAHVVEGVSGEDLGVGGAGAGPGVLSISGGMRSHSKAGVLNPEVDAAVGAEMWILKNKRALADSNSNTSLSGSALSGNGAGELGGGGKIKMEEIRACYLKHCELRGIREEERPKLSSGWMDSFKRRWGLMGRKNKKRGRGEEEGEEVGKEAGPSSKRMRMDEAVAGGDGEHEELRDQKERDMDEERDIELDLAALREATLAGEIAGVEMGLEVDPALLPAEAEAEDDGTYDEVIDEGHHNTPSTSQSLPIVAGQHQTQTPAAAREDSHLPTLLQQNSPRSQSQAQQEQEEPVDLSHLDPAHRELAGFLASQAAVSQAPAPAPGVGVVGRNE